MINNIVYYQFQHICFRYVKEKEEIRYKGNQMFKLLFWFLQDLKGLVNDFAHRMSHATEERPLVLLIDGVDGLAEENDGRKMGWFPRDLPPYVKVILSTLPEEKHQCLQALQKVYIVLYHSWQFNFKFNINIPKDEYINQRILDVER